MEISTAENPLAKRIAEAMIDGFNRHYRLMRHYGRQAKILFEAADWKGVQTAVSDRIRSYDERVQENADLLCAEYSAASLDNDTWQQLKLYYIGQLINHKQPELAETFFNSVTRKIFSTVGVDPRIEFVDTDYDAPPLEPAAPIYRTYPGGVPTAHLVSQIIEAAELDTSFDDIERDCVEVSRRIDDRVQRVGGLKSIDRIEVIGATFFRGRGAYLIGRIWAGSVSIPLVIALLHDEGGVAVDAVLLTENNVSILFSFTRSYFHADVTSPNSIIHFLSTLMPRKRRAELYISLGHNKHGKTELYRELRRHMTLSGEKFQTARGTQGLVMMVFTLPGFDVVLKVIRDRFGEPKKLTRDHVLSRYKLVFRHDRAGRLVDAQEYDHLEFPRSRFDESLLETLASECGRSVEVTDTTVGIAHAYVERRVTPLDVFLAEAQLEAAEAAVIDYGSAIKELAASGIFPGDMLLKNFGVTRHGRVVFYDYDELTTLDECNFRTLPVASSYDDEMSAEPWFAVGPDDVFPQEFATFLGIQGELRRTFMDRHADIFDPATWRSWQARVGRGELIEIIPYDERLRF
jgi:isocitrate dehydrogenase kinase/phosphatase